MASKYINKFKVPKNFENILSDFAKEVLRNQPKDIIDFGVEYFKSLEEKKNFDYNDKGENRPECYKRPENQEPNIINVPNKLEISIEDKNRLQRSMNKIEKINKEIVPKEVEEDKKEEPIKEKPPEKESLSQGRYGNINEINEIHKKEYDNWFTKHSVDKQAIDYKPEKEEENIEIVKKNEMGYKTWFNNHSVRSSQSGEMQNEEGKEEEKEKDLFKKNSKEKIDMEYRYLGNSGLRVSALGWGSMMMGSDTHENNVNAIKTLISYGINFFDSAEIYDLGQCELALGKAIKELKIPREKIVVTTKIFRNGNDPNDSFLSRKHIIEGINQSLKRLQMKYVDIIFCHRPDKNTPLEETCRAMNYVLKKGMAFYWGTSEWDADQIIKAMKICEKLKLIGPIVDQTQYNLLHRQRIEREYANLFKNFKYGITVWSPLFSGVLTGKYIESIPDESRYKKHSELNGYGLDYYFNNKKEIDAKLRKLRDLAKNKLNCNLAQLSIAWILANPDISTIILGSTKMSQVEDVLPAIQIYKKLDKNILKEIEEIMGNSTIGPWDYETFTLLKNRRNELLDVDYVANPDFTK